MEEVLVETGVDTCDQELEEHYNIVSTLGYGTFAQVKLGHHRLTNFPVAIKIISVEEVSDFSVTQEVTVMEELHHANIIQMFHVIESVERVYMVLEYASGGDLGKLISELGSLREAQAQDVFAQVLSAVDYCHGRGIVHRDITPQHILIAAEWQIKLSHFALATRVTKGQKLQTCGSPLFCAPEVLSDLPYDGFSADMWSLGAVLYHMMTGSLPMEESTDWMLDFHILASPQVSTGITDILEHLLSVIPGDRPTAGHLLQHPWVKDVKESPQPCVRDTFSSMPNPTTLGAMFRLGYRPSEVLRCIQEKVYNEIHATYLIMNHHGPCVDSREQEPQAEMEASATSPLTRSLSQPILSTLARPDTHHHCDKFRKKKGRAHSTPPTLWCPPDPAPPLVPEAVDRMSCSSEVSECSLPSELASSKSMGSLTSGTQDEERSSLSKDTALEAEAIPVERATSTRSGRRGWRGVMSRIGKGLRTLCCCVPARRNPTAPKEDVATEAGDFAAAEQNRGESPCINNCVEGMGQSSTQTCNPGSQAGGAGDNVLPGLAQTPPSRPRGGLCRLTRCLRPHRSPSAEWSPPDAQHGMARRSPCVSQFGDHPEHWLG